MPFETYEKSTFSGQPIQLYEFLRTSGGSDFFWRYNTSDRDITYADDLYAAVPISDGGVKLSGEPAATEFQISMPITSEFCQEFRLAGTVPSDSIFVRVRRVHAADIDDLDGAMPAVVTGTARLVWIGTVNGITQVDDIAAQVTCATLAASFRRGGLRYGWTKSCPHMLYGKLCTMNKESFRTDGVITAVTSTSVTATEWDALDDGELNGGFIEYVLSSGVTERRMVISHTGGVLSLLDFVSGITIGDTVKAYSGCDRTIGRCNTRFNNILNFGGFPQSPGRNPFDGKPVY